jgi:hypothetical protein
LSHGLKALLSLEHIDGNQVMGCQEAFSNAWLLLRQLSTLWATPFARSTIDSIRRGRQRCRDALVTRMLMARRAFPKLMVLRLDLGYRREWVDSMAPQGHMFKDWEVLKAFLNSAFASSFVGYAVKAEYGVKKGVHMHLLLLFDGSVVRQDVTIGRLVGEHWNNVVTQGAGVYFNCNTPAYKNRFSYCGVGVFNRLDEACVAGFQKMADYMAKEDFLVRVVMPAHSRFFRCNFRNVTLAGVDTGPLD